MLRSRPRPSTAGERCPVCNESITWRQARTFKTCRSVHCGRLYRERQRARRLAEAEQFAQQHRHRLDRAAAARATDAAAGEVEDPESYTIVVLSANRREVTRLPGRRRGRFVKRLRRLVESAFAGPPDDLVPISRSEDEHPELTGILGGACATCRGQCCLKGGTHAFLHESTIQRYRRAHPGATAREVIEAYIHHLPPRTYRNGCVFQSATGCTLPRSMRSRTCNNTICGGLIETRDLVLRSGQARFYFAAMRGDEVVRSRFAQR